MTFGNQDPSVNRAFRPQKSPRISNTETPSMRPRMPEETMETPMPTMKTTLALPAATCAAAFLLGGCQHTHSHQDLNGT